jgi:hypothetical protein
MIFIKIILLLPDFVTAYYQPLVIFVVCVCVVFFFFFQVGIYLRRYPKSLGVQGKAPASNGDNGVMINVGIPTYQPGFNKLPNSFRRYLSFHRSRDTKVLKRLFRISSLEITEPYLYSSGTNNYRPCIVIGVHVRILINNNTLFHGLL